MVDKNAYNRLYNMVEEFERKLRQEFKNIDIPMFLLSYSSGKIYLQIQREYGIENAEDVIADAVKEVFKEMKGERR